MPGPYSRESILAALTPQALGAATAQQDVPAIGPPSPPIDPTAAFNARLSAADPTAAFNARLAGAKPPPPMRAPVPAQDARFRQALMSASQQPGRMGAIAGAALGPTPYANPGAVPAASTAAKAEAPIDEATGLSGKPLLREALKNAEQTGAAEKQGILAKDMGDQVIAAHIQGMAEDTEKRRLEMAQREQERVAQLKEGVTQANQALEAVRSGKIDPNRIYANASTATKIGLGLGAIAGGIAGHGQGNAFMDHMNGEIQKDIALQKDQLGRTADYARGKMNLLGELRANFGSERAGENVLEQMHLQAVQDQLASLKMRALGPMAQANLAKIDAAVANQKMQLRSQFAQMMATTGPAAKPIERDLIVNDENGNAVQFADKKAAQEYKEMQAANEALKGHIDRARALHNKYYYSNLPGSPRSAEAVLHPIDFDRATKELKGRSAQAAMSELRASGARLSVGALQHAEETITNFEDPRALQAAEQAYQANKKRLSSILKAQRAESLATGHVLTRAGLAPAAVYTGETRTKNPEMPKSAREVGADNEDDNAEDEDGEE